MANEAHELGHDYDHIVVTCPYCPPEAPNPEHSQPLGVFIETEVGRFVLEPLINKADELRSEGADFDEAVNTAFGRVAVRGEDESYVNTNADELKRAKASFDIGATLAAHGLHEDRPPANQPVSSSEAGGPPGGNDMELMVESSGSAGNSLRQRRSMLGLSEFDVARQANLPVEYYVKIESAELTPPNQVFQRLLSILELSSSDIYR